MVYVIHQLQKIFAASQRLDEFIPSGIYRIIIYSNHSFVKKECIPESRTLS